MSVLYGPVPSWRLGRSLGIDLISTRGKTCAFDCVFCQLGQITHSIDRRMLVAANSGQAEEMATLARGLEPDGVQLNTPLRPGGATRLSPGEIAEIKLAFAGLLVVESHSAQRPDLRPLDTAEM